MEVIFVREVVLYIAMSLDGFIADKNGQVSFLQGDGSDSTHQGSYQTFLSTIDTIIMGYKTYDQVIRELSPNQWPYEGLKSYVVTHRNIENLEHIEFYHKDLEELIKQLKKEDGKNIWICGGANLIKQLMNMDLIDTYHITVIPALIGQGIKLFQSTKINQRLKLQSSLSYNGMVDLVYKKSI